MAEKDPDHIQRLFAKQGLRCTSQRRAIYKSLSASTAHPTADQLFYEVSGLVSGMSLATVYNTLEALCQVGLAQKLYGKGGSVRYDAAVHNHIHTRCEKSGAVHDLPEELNLKLHSAIPRSLLRQIGVQMGFRVDQVKMELIGEYTG